MLNNSQAVIGLAKSCTITHQGDAVEISPQNGGTAREFVPGRTGATVEVSGLMTAVADLLILRNTYALEIHDGSDSVYCNAFVTMVKQTGTIGNLAQQSVVFQVTGALSDTAPSQET